MIFTIWCTHYVIHTWIAHLGEFYRITCYILLITITISRLILWIFLHLIFQLNIGQMRQRCVAYCQDYKLPMGSWVFEPEFLQGMNVTHVLVSLLLLKFTRLIFICIPQFRKGKRGPDPRVSIVNSLLLETKQFIMAVTFCDLNKCVS